MIWTLVELSSTDPERYTTLTAIHRSATPVGGAGAQQSWEKVRQTCVSSTSGGGWNHTLAARGTSCESARFNFWLKWEWRKKNNKVPEKHQRQTADFSPKGYIEELSSSSCEETQEGVRILLTSSPSFNHTASKRWKRPFWILTVRTPRTTLGAWQSRALTVNQAG